MRRLPGPLGRGEMFAWRLDHARHAARWNSGEGAWLVGGRWSPRGLRAIYCALDPATAILEVAVHVGFKALDTAAHVLTALLIVDQAALHEVELASIPNPNWLRPGIPSAGQQAFGAELLGRHGAIMVPSVVSTHSWNLVLDAALAPRLCRLVWQEEFALDTRLHPGMAGERPGALPLGTAGGSAFRPASR